MATVLRKKESKAVIQKAVEEALLKMDVSIPSKKTKKRIRRFSESLSTPVKKSLTRKERKHPNINATSA